MNPPAAPVGCETCGAVAGARCRTGLGTPALRIHAARARAVVRYHEGVSTTLGQNVVVLTDWKHNRRAQ